VSRAQRGRHLGRSALLAAPGGGTREHQSSGGGRTGVCRRSREPEKRQGALEERQAPRTESNGGSHARDREHWKRTKKQGAPEAATHGEKSPERPRARIGSRRTKSTQERDSVRVRVTR
jgi:hypothetical protein